MAPEDDDVTTLPPPPPKPDAELATVSAAPTPTPVDSHPSSSVPGRSGGLPLPEPELPPELTERFEILSTLGRGGMGVVYLGRDRRLERQVALKLMLSSSRAMREAFESEGKVLAALEHENIVRLYDFGFAGEIPYLVMEYVRGQPLSARLAEGRPTVLETVRIACETLAGVLAAHRQGIVHRDLKPANVFLDETGRAKVADFGVARRRKGNDDSGSGEICGTPGFMAPEQGRGRATGPAADIYAFAVMLHQMLTGQRLWAGTSLKEILKAQETSRPASPAELNPSVPRVLADAVLAALAVEPEKRPGGDELLATLSGWQDRVRRLSREPGPTGFPPVPYKRLEHFGPADAVIFFGRHAETLELVDAISADVRILSIFGPCGIGKSSLVHAGLVPALRSAGHDVLSVVSGPDPAQALREAIAARALAQDIRLPSGEPISASALALAPDLVLFAMVELARAAKRTQTIVLDQLEEVFTQNPHDTPRTGAIFDLLVRLVESQVKGVKIVLSYRSEFHASFFPIEERLARYRRPYLVRQISEDGLVEAIEGPATIEIYGFRYADGVAARIAREILAAAGDQGDTPLPVMQIIASQLYERMKLAGRNVIDAAAYERLGGVAGALSRYIEDKLAGPEYAAGAGIARQMLKCLTVKEEGRERFSRARDEDEVLDFPDRGAARITLERLVADHLVVRQVDGEKRSVRLASEVICKLVDGWEVEPDATGRAYRVLVKHYRQWLDAGRRHEELLTGGALALVAAELGAMKDATEPERDFVARSLRTRRRQRIERGAGFGVLAAVVLVLGWFAFLRPGTLQLASEPSGADVFAAGVRLGRTPFSFPARPGVYSFMLKKERHEDTQEVVQVSAGATVVSTPTLPYSYGLLQVSSAPLGARCEVRRSSDKQPVAIGKTPFTEDVLPGTYQLSFTMPGYLPRRLDDVVVHGNRAFTLRTLTLAPDAGALTVGSPYEGVEMDLFDAAGRLVWESALPVRAPKELPVGRYEMRCTRSGSVSYTHSVDITLGTTAAYTAWVPPVKVAWSAKIGTTVAPPALGDLDGDRALDVVVANEEGHVIALCGITGEELWRHPLGDDVSGAPAVADVDGDGVVDVLVGSAARAFVALSGRTGQPLWTYPAGGGVEAAAAAADLSGDGRADVTFGSKDGRVHALDGATGKPLWVYATGGAVRSGPALADLDGDRVPDVLIGSKDRALHAISGKTGAGLWQHRTEGWTATPAVADLDGDGVADAVFGSADDHVYAVSGKDGRRLWSFATASLIAWAPGLADLNGDGVPDAVIGSTDHSVYALDGKSGRLLWKVATGGAVRATPMMADMDADGVPDATIGSTDGRVWVLSGKDGEPIWTHFMGGRVNTPATADLVGDSVPEVIATCGAGTCAVLSARPGGTQWVYDGGSPVRSRPLVGDVDGDGEPDAVLAGDDRQVRAVAGRTGLLAWKTEVPAALSGALIACEVDGRGRPDVLVPCADGTLVALSGEDGHRLWTQRDDEKHASHAAGTPAVLPARGGRRARVAVARPLHVDVLSAVDGTILAHCPIGDGTGGQSRRPAHLAAAPAPVAGVDLVAATGDGTLIGIDSATGRVAWRYPVGDRLAAPGIADLDGDGAFEVVAGGEDRRVVAVALATGRLLWETALPAPLGTPPAFSDFDNDGKLDVAIGSLYRQVHALSGLGGRALWSADAGGPLSDPPQLADLDGDGRADVIVGASDGKVHVLSGRDGAALIELPTGVASAGPVVASTGSAKTPVMRLLTVNGVSLVMMSRLRWPFRSVTPRWLTR